MSGKNNVTITGRFGWPVAYRGITLWSGISDGLPDFIDQICWNIIKFTNLIEQLLNLFNIASCKLFSTWLYMKKEYTNNHEEVQSEAKEGTTFVNNYECKLLSYSQHIAKYTFYLTRDSIIINNIFLILLQTVLTKSNYLYRNVG